MTHVFVGNDVVDLTNPRTAGRASEDRFIGRVFDADEQQALLAAGATDLELWSRWAAKEAGFKAISKALGTPPAFVHRSFKVAWSEAQDAADGVVRVGTVRYHERTAGVTVEAHPGAVHAVAQCHAEAARVVSVARRVASLDTPGSRWSGTLEELRRRLTALEADAVYSIPSAAVRIGARGDLAELLGLDERRLEIVCAPGPTSQRPPRVLLDGRGAPADVSLSHDGRWIAWAIWIHPGEGRQP